MLEQMISEIREAASEYMLNPYYQIAVISGFKALQSFSSAFIKSIYYNSTSVEKILTLGGLRDYLFGAIIAVGIERAVYDGSLNMCINFSLMALGSVFATYVGRKTAHLFHDYLYKSNIKN